jgi:anaerobic magnesium-protoporphyrin IX monomethyl ester cyclase
VGVSVAYPLPGTVFFERVKGQLGGDRHWQDSDDLAMLFEGTYTGPFYRRLRDLLHEEATAASASGEMAGARWRRLDLLWQQAGKEESSFRTTEREKQLPGLGSSR